MWKSVRQEAGKNNSTTLASLIACGDAVGTDSEEDGSNDRRLILDNEQGVHSKLRSPNNN